MADHTTQFVNQAQEINRSFVDAVQSMAGAPFNAWQRLSEIQMGVVNQSFEVANDQLQIISRVRDPREFATAQAELVKNHGQRYVDSVKQAVDALAEAWEECSDRLEKSMSSVADKTQRATSSRKAA